MKEYTVRYTVDITKTFKDREDLPDSKKYFEKWATVETALGDLDDFKIIHLKVFEREHNEGEAE